MTVRELEVPVTDSTVPVRVITIVGVIPDANGIGEPDIMMAKRIAPR